VFCRLTYKSPISIPFAYDCLTPPQFVLQKTFLPYLVHNGKFIERDSAMGPFFRLTCLPDDETVGNKYFSHPLEMTNVERVYLMKRLGHKMEVVYQWLFKIFSRLLDYGGIAKAGLLSWIAAVLLGNQKRTMIRGSRNSCSSDTLLSTLSNVMMLVWVHHFPSLQVCIYPVGFLFCSVLRLSPVCRTSCCIRPLNSFDDPLTTPFIVFFLLRLSFGNYSCPLLIPSVQFWSQGWMAKNMKLVLLWMERQERRGCCQCGKSGNVANSPMRMVSRRSIAMHG